MGNLPKNLMTDEDIKNINKQLSKERSPNTGLRLTDAQIAMKENERLKKRIEKLEQRQEVGQHDTLVTGMNWVDADIDTPHDGDYLCAIRSPQNCGNVHIYQRVVENKFNKWDLQGGEELICWSKLPKIPTEYQ